MEKSLSYQLHKISSDATVMRDITYSLIFWSRKVIEGVKNHVRSCFEKASLVHFFSFRNFWSRVKRQVWSIFKLFEKASLVQIRRKNWTKLAFFKTSPTRDSNYSKKATLVQIFLRIWTKLAFSNNLNMDQTCLFEATPHVILDSFKHFSGPKYKTIRSTCMNPGS